MSQTSPTKSNESRCSFSKKIRINLNSKFIPEDFFPSSISQLSKRKRIVESGRQTNPIRKSSLNQGLNGLKNQFEQQAINMELLKKRLIKIKQSSQLETNQQQNKKVSFKRRSNSRDGLRKLMEKSKSKEKIPNAQKVKSKGYSKKLMDYMEKMKNVINIDLKFEEDYMCPALEKQSKESAKQNPEDIETDDSPKNQRRRPKSQINSRQRLCSKQKVQINSNRIISKPLKIKVKQVSKIMKQSLQGKVKCKNDRYNKFIDIPLDQDGMLTFYGSPNQKTRNSYDSKKYTLRSSLPKLQK